jgi:hypothetical protein
MIHAGKSLLTDYYMDNGKVVNKSLTILTRKRQGLRVITLQGLLLDGKGFFLTK